VIESINSGNDVFVCFQLCTVVLVPNSTVLCQKVHGVGHLQKMSLHLMLYIMGCACVQEKARDGGKECGGNNHKLAASMFLQLKSAEK